MRSAKEVSSWFELAVKCYFDNDPDGHYEFDVADAIKELIILCPEWVTFRQTSNEFDAPLGAAVDVTNLFNYCGEDYVFIPSNVAKVAHLVRLHYAYGYPGIILWAALHREIRPVPGVCEFLKSMRVWDDRLDNFPTERADKEDAQDD